MLTLGTIASRHGDAYLTRHGAAVLPSYRRALQDLAACRTDALGGHVSGCDQCGYEHFTYHSCRKRSCLQHVLPRGFHKVRYYGMWHSSAAPLRARLALPLASPTHVTGETTRVTPSGGDTSPRPCPRCEHGTLRRTGIIARTPLRRPTAMAP